MRLGFPRFCDGNGSSRERGACCCGAIYTQRISDPASNNSLAQRQFQARAIFLGRLPSNSNSSPAGTSEGLRRTQRTRAAQDRGVQARHRHHGRTLGDLRWQGLFGLSRTKVRCGPDYRTRQGARRQTRGGDGAVPDLAVRRFRSYVPATSSGFLKLDGRVGMQRIWTGIETFLPFRRSTKPKRLLRQAVADTGADVSFRHSSRCATGKAACSSFPTLTESRYIGMTTTSPALAQSTSSKQNRRGILMELRSVTA